jgi:hypothetical protein
MGRYVILTLSLGVTTNTSDLSTAAYRLFDCS